MFKTIPYRESCIVCALCKWVMYENNFYFL